MSTGRSVGLNESAAEWLLLLDDDVVPDPEILDEYAAAARNPGHGGFVGFSELPELREAFPVAFYLSAVSLSWRAARQVPRVPRGVTTNLLVKNAPSTPSKRPPSHRDGLNGFQSRDKFNGIPSWVELLHLLHCAAAAARLRQQLPLPRPAASAVVSDNRNRWPAADEQRRQRHRTEAGPGGQLARPAIAGARRSTPPAPGRSRSAGPVSPAGPGAGAPTAAPATTVTSAGSVSPPRARPGGRALRRE